MSALLGLPFRQGAGTTLARKGQAGEGAGQEGAGNGCWSQRPGCGTDRCGHIQGNQISKG